MAHASDDELAEPAVHVLSNLLEWRSQHPQATFRQIEAAVELQIDHLRAQLLSQVAQHSPLTDWHELEPAQQPTCPDCGQPLTPHGLETRRLRSQHDEPVLLERQYGRCPQCERGLFPPG